MSRLWRVGVWLLELWSNSCSARVGYLFTDVGTPYAQIIARSPWPGLSDALIRRMVPSVCFWAESEGLRVNESSLRVLDADPGQASIVPVNSHQFGLFTTVYLPTDPPLELWLP